MVNIDQLITEFLGNLEKRKRTLRTVRNYDFYLRRFSVWLKEKNISSPEDINKDLIKKYKTYLKRIKNPIKKINLKETTQNYHLIALREFLKFLYKKNVLTTGSKQVHLHKVKSVKVSSLKKDEIGKFLEAPQQIRQDALISHRDRAVLEIMFCTGAKVSEVADLVIKDVDFKKQQVIVAKGRKNERVIDLSNQSVYWVSKYLKSRGGTLPYLFVGHDRAKSKRKQKPISARSLERIVLKYGKVAGLEKKVTPQILRSTYATNLVKKGLGFQSIKNKLGTTSDGFLNL